MVDYEDITDRKPIPVSGPEGSEHIDVIVVGAGISGIDAGYRLQEKCPHKRYVIFEGRSSIGGTWDLFKYPGIRSDSDMHTLGYPFAPWTGSKSIADGASICNYVVNTAKQFGIDKHIRFNHKVVKANWCSKQSLWFVEVLHESKLKKFSCHFLYMCSGYYDYEQGHAPTWDAMDTYKGIMVHPQFWPDDLDYKDKKIVVIGSGATAVTLVPSLAQEASHVTMLQRSPTYIVSRPSHDGIANSFHKVLPSSMAYRLARIKNVLLGMYFYGLAKRKPVMIRQRLLSMIKDHLGDKYQSQHFSPNYNPWDQRLCLVPDADLFKAIKSGRADIVTDEIESFTEQGLKLKSGAQLEADIIVTATGLKVKLLGGMSLQMDGEEINLGDKFNYKGMMFNDIPNFALSFGYTNASWTLKCDLIALYMCRLLNHMDKQNLDFCVPRLGSTMPEVDPQHALTSGYIERSRHILPKQSMTKPWRQHHNYALDLMDIKYSAVNDNVMEFHRKKA